METLRAHLNGMSVADQQRFAEACGTSIGYLRKAISLGQRLGESLAISIERESGGAVTCEELCPGVDWAYIRGRSSGGVKARRGKAA